MYPSANIVVFVNEDDMKNEVLDAINKRSYKDEPLMLSVSYNTDLLAFENVKRKNIYQIMKKNYDLINFMNFFVM